MARISRLVIVCCVVCTVALGSSSTPAVSTDDPFKDPLSGIWHVAGREAGEAYFGVAVITLREDSSGLYRVDYAVLGNHSVGVGLLKGKMFSVAWRSIDNPKAFGVSQFELVDAKTLKGFWAATGSDEPRPETLKFLRKTEDKGT